MTTGPLDQSDTETSRPAPVVESGPGRLGHVERAEQTAGLLARAAEAEQAGDEDTYQACVGRVVELNMRVAEAVARRYARRGVPLEDLTQVAYLALVRAVRGYEPGEGRDLLAYAVPTITGEIRRHFRDQGWTIRPPRSVQRTHGAVVRSGASLDRMDERAVLTLAEEVEESVELVREALRARSCFSLVSLDAPVLTDDGSVTSREVPQPRDRDVERAEARMVVEPLVAALSPREREVLSLRFAEELSQREIAERLGMSQVQVSRLLQRVLGQLRQTLDQAG